MLQVINNKKAKAFVITLILKFIIYGAELNNDSNDS